MEKSISEDNKNISTQKKRGKSSNSANTSRIKELRERLGLTQQEFADQLNRDFQMISHIERGTKGLYLPLAIEISKEFGVSLDWLYELSDDTKDNASNIIVNLRDIFDIDFKEKRIGIDDNLVTFLEELSNAYKIKGNKANNVSDETFKHWVDGIKKTYNEKGKSDKTTYYYLQTVNEHFREETPQDFSNRRINKN